jgi:hypothetical protein
MHHVLHVTCLTSMGPWFSTPNFACDIGPRAHNDCSRGTCALSCLVRPQLPVCAVQQLILARIGDDMDTLCCDIRANPIWNLAAATADACNTPGVRLAFGSLGIRVTRFFRVG